MERDGWLVAIEASSAGAKANRENLVASEGYKSQLDKLGMDSKLPVLTAEMMC